MISRGQIESQIRRSPMKKTPKKMMRGGLAGAAGRVPPQAATTPTPRTLPVMKRGGKVKAKK
jgi:hypothetical protein